MDLNEFSAEDKISKFLEFNNLDNSFVNYSVNPSASKDETKQIDVSTIPGVDRLKQGIFSIPKLPVNTVRPYYDKKGEFKMEEIEPDKHVNAGLEKLMAKMPDLKSISDKQRAIIDSIDKTKYDPEMKNYLKLLAYKESRFNPTVKNQFGYVGLYQFGKDAFDWVGIKKEDYLKDINLQHKAAATLAEKNFKGLEGYVGKTIGGIKLTKSGLMAAAHLGGRGNVMKFLNSNGKEVFKDGNNVPITHYMKYFSV